MTEPDHDDSTGPTVMTPARGEARPKDRAWLRLFLMALFVIMVSGAFAYLMRNEYLTDEKGALTVEFGDQFDRPADAKRLGVTPSGREWRSVKGTFGVDGGVAIVSSPSDGSNIAVVGSLEYPTITARVSGRAACGVVGRFVDESNYVVVRRAPILGFWLLVAVRGGKETVLGQLPDDKSPAATVRLDTASKAVSMIVNGKSVTAIDPSERRSTAVGLFTGENGASNCAWDDVKVFAAT